jgi:hypothetical protein
MICEGEPVSVTPHVGTGIFYIFHGSFYMITTIPCLLVIAQKEMLKYSCYKIMLAIGILDICNLIISCFVSGVFSLTGTTFCNHETIMTISGRFMISEFLYRTQQSPRNRGSAYV